MKVIYTGLESAGKTLILADKVMSLISRNQKWYKKYGFKRQIYLNIRLSDVIYQKYKDYLVYWSDMSEIIGNTGCDIIWDEISTDFSALKQSPMPKEINRWLRQGAKQGVHIYATAQEFHDVHLDFRRRVFSAFKVNKIIGSRRVGRHLPPVHTVWGLIAIRELKIHPYNELQPEFLGLFPGLLWISSSLCDVFNTNQVINASEGVLYSLEHITKNCSVCGYKKISHN